MTHLEAILFTVLGKNIGVTCIKFLCIHVHLHLNLCYLVSVVHLPDPFIIISQGSCYEVGQIYPLCCSQSWYEHLCIFRWIHFFSLYTILALRFLICKLKIYKEKCVIYLMQNFSRFMVLVYANQHKIVNVSVVMICLRCVYASVRAISRSIFIF